MIKHRPNDPFCECYDCTFNVCKANKQIGDSLRDWNELPKWIRDAYHRDAAIQHVVKDWRMTKKPLADLFEKLAIRMLELKNYWQMTHENAIKSAQIPSRIKIWE